jgi:hypothetical protein
MTWKWPVYFSIGLFAVFVGFRYNASRNAQDAVSEDGPAFLNWPPSAADVIRVTAANGADPKTSDGQKARDRFVSAFKGRYRLHEPMIAVGLRFHDDHVMDLMVPARMEPWNIDRLAVEAWKEAGKAFGHPFDVDLYISYIGVPRIKIGELRQSSVQPGKATIVYFKKGIPSPPAHHTLPANMRMYGQSRRGGPWRPLNLMPPARQTGKLPGPGQNKE